ncbi:MAG: hypothetical protein K2H38_08045 [Muribaculaceae bacterium]|nr:hypothetical protein [Muribaculaceae bacterium]
MKKLMTFALCFAAIGSVSAQKEVLKAAKKLSGNPDKIEEARSLINQAMQNPETANNAETYLIAGKIEFDAYDKDSLMIQIDQTKVDPLKMSENLLNGYNLFVKALPLTAIPDEKGKTDTKTAKQIATTLKKHINHFDMAGGTFYNADKKYPEAYQCFMIYADMPEQDFMQGQKLAIADTLRGRAYFNAGISALLGKEFIKGADAFRNARRVGYDDNQAFIYEISCWQSLLERDSTMEQTAKEKIMEVAEEGNRKFGVEQPVFFNYIINYLVMDDKFDQALSQINNQIAAYPNNPNLYGLRAFVYDRIGKDNESVDDYRKAIAIENVDFDTLKRAARKIFRVGTVMWDAIEGDTEQDRAARADIKTNYFIAAKSIAEKAKANANDDYAGDIDTLLENIDYVISLAK